jgi:hypothetical protein
MLAAATTPGRSRARSGEDAAPDLRRCSPPPGGGRAMRPRLRRRSQISAHLDRRLSRWTHRVGVSHLPRETPPPDAPNELAPRVAIRATDEREDGTNSWRVFLPPRGGGKRQESARDRHTQAPQAAEVDDASPERAADYVLEGQVGLPAALRASAGHRDFNAVMAEFSVTPTQFAALPSSTTCSRCRRTSSAASPPWTPPPSPA